MVKDLYNILFGENKEFGVLLGVLGMTKKQIGAYEDIYVTEDKQRIILFTKLGEKENNIEHLNFLRGHKHYLKDYPDSGDNGYIYFEFSIPEERKLICESIGGEKVLTITEKMDRELDLLLSGDEGAKERAGIVVEEIAFNLAESLYLKGLKLMAEEEKDCEEGGN